MSEEELSVFQGCMSAAGNSTDPTMMVLECVSNTTEAVRVKFLRRPRRRFLCLRLPAWLTLILFVCSFVCLRGWLSSPTQQNLQAAVDSLTTGLNTFFLIYGGALVFFMQLGFAMLCAGTCFLLALGCVCLRLNLERGRSEIGSGTHPCDSCLGLAVGHSPSLTFLLLARIHPQ